MNREQTSGNAVEPANSRASAEDGKAATILVALDGSEHALAALPVASALADVEQGSLHVLHVAEPLLPPRELLQKVGLTVEDIRGSVISQGRGDPAEGIVEAAREQQSLCIVLCTHTGMEKPAGALGGVARAILLAAPCPVVLVPPWREFRPLELRHILLPYDGNPTTAAAIGPALELAEKAGADVTVLHVAGARKPQNAEPGTLAAPRYIDQPHHEWPAWSHELLQRVCCLARVGQAERLQLMLAAGEPEDEIPRYAQEHPTDLIVVAWHGDPQTGHAAVAKAVMRETPCPVLVLRVHEGAEGSDRQGSESWGE